MKKGMLVVIVTVLCGAGQANAQALDIVAIIKGAISKVIKAADLEIQRLQTQTIWAQNAQKELENEMTLLKLDDITNWVQQQKNLYAEYYDELKQVKAVISGYDKVKLIVQEQAKIVYVYQSAYGRFRSDSHFSTGEIDAMYKVYAGIVSESVKNLEQVSLVINAFVTQMTDGERINIINAAASGMQRNYDDLMRFTNENIQLSLQRSRDADDLETVRKVYGLK